MQTIYGILGLGLLGIDPLGAIVASTAIAAKVKKSRVLLFGLTYFSGTVIIGVVMSILGQEAIDFVQSFIPDDFSPAWAILNLLIVLIISGWLLIRFLKRNKPKKTPKKKTLLGGVWQIIAVGLIFAASSLTDPTFYAVIILAAESHNILSMIGLHLLWVCVCQLPLILITGAYYLNIHQKLLSKSAKLWRLHRQKFIVVLYLIAILICLLLLADSAVYLVSGQYMF